MKKIVVVMLVLFGIGLFCANLTYALTSLVGDKDGFGGQVGAAVPVNGTVIGSGFDNRTGSDPLFTDFYGFEQTTLPSPINYSHTYAIPVGEVATAATLSIQSAGLSDGRGPWEVFFNAVSIGLLGDMFGGGSHTRSYLYQLVVPVALLTGLDAISLVYRDTQPEGMAFNFSELDIQTAPIPEPASLLLLAVGLLGLVGLRRKLKK